MSFKAEVLTKVVRAKAKGLTLVEAYRAVLSKLHDDLEYAIYFDQDNTYAGQILFAQAKLDTLPTIEPKNSFGDAFPQLKALI